MSIPSASEKRPSSVIRSSRKASGILFICAALAGCAGSSGPEYAGGDRSSNAGGVVLASTDQSDSAGAEYESAPMTVSADRAATTTAQAISTGSPAPAQPSPPPQPARPSGSPQAAAVEQSAGETYAHTPENGLMDTAQDAMSTFSLDVDTASYTLARSDLTAGRLPRPEGVRVEEWINFFRYDEPAPSGSDAPFSVRVESAPSYFGQGRHLLRVAVRAKEIPAAQRPAANIVFLVDV